tara:strand:+ start:1315 stop:1857 length:543 start_codon:yes stop_codon:yes gene_type:complete
MNSLVHLDFSSYELDYSAKELTLGPVNARQQNHLGELAEALHLLRLFLDHCEFSSNFVLLLVSSVLRSGLATLEPVAINIRIELNRNDSSDYIMSDEILGLFHRCRKFAEEELIKVFETLPVSCVGLREDHEYDESEMGQLPPIVLTFRVLVRIICCAHVSLSTEANFQQGNPFFELFEM